MQKILVVVLLLLTVIVFQFCHTQKKLASAATASVTYEGTIKPVIQGNCTPCHIEGKGKVKPLDNYTNASADAEEILSRIQKNPGDRGFMPAMHPKLSDSTISLFLLWKNSGLKEK